MLETKRTGSVMVVGGGVAGVQAALDLADSGYSVYLVEKTGAIGGAMSRLDKTFPTNDCSMCIIAPKLVECGRHPRIKLMTLSEVTGIEGDIGDFTVTVKESPRYVDMQKCKACGACVVVCPKKTDNEYDGATSTRKAIYVKYPQAVPLKYQIDPDTCLRIGGRDTTCGLCEEACVVGAIDFGDTEKIHEIRVGAVILAPGFEIYDPTEAGVWGYGKNPNVITSLQMERFLSATGPTDGRLLRPSDGRPVNKVAFLQCIGSRDEKLCGNGYCSSICCMFAVKEAVIAKEHAPAVSSSIFFMDLRAHGKDFDRYVDRAQKEVGVRFVRCKVNGVEAVGDSGDLRLRYVNEQGRQIEELFDLVVLSVGLKTGSRELRLAETAGIRLTAEHFAAASTFTPVQTSRKGVYICGVFGGPKDIPHSVVEGSAAAAAVAESLAPAPNDWVLESNLPPEKDVGGEDPRIGVFICHCGSNIAGVVDVAELAEHARTLPNVVYVERNLFACSQDAQDILVDRIREYGLNRIVVASCTPLTHEPLFRETLRSAGLNEYLVEMANIRNHCAWVHQDNPAMATAKSLDLVRMAVAKVAHSVSLQPVKVPIVQKGLVVGGGVAGMTAALNLAQQGFEVHLVERTDALGGNALHLKDTWSGEHIPSQIAKLIDKVVWNDRLIIHKEFEVSKVDGFVGNFRTTIKTKNGLSKTLEHGACIIASGGSILSPNEYGYRTIKKVVTSIEFDKLHELKEKHVGSANTFVFIQCVGSREEEAMYCSKVCCTHSVQTAIELKKEDPKRHIFILYRDMRTYAQRENLYPAGAQDGRGVHQLRTARQTGGQGERQDPSMSRSGITSFTGRSRSKRIWSFSPPPFGPRRTRGTWPRSSRCRWTATASSSRPTPNCVRSISPTTAFSWPVWLITPSPWRSRSPRPWRHPPERPPCSPGRR